VSCTNREEGIKPKDRLVLWLFEGGEKEVGLGVLLREVERKA